MGKKKQSKKSTLNVTYGGKADSTRVVSFATPILAGLQDAIQANRVPDRQSRFRSEDQARRERQQGDEARATRFIVGDALDDVEGEFLGTKGKIVNVEQGTEADKRIRVTVRFPGEEYPPRFIGGPPDSHHTRKYILTVEEERQAYNPGIYF